MRNKNRNIFYLISACVFATLLVSCGSTGETSFRARIINGVDDLSAITARFDNQIYFEELAYAEGSSFFDVPGLTSRLRIGSPDFPLPLLESDITAENQQFRTFIVLRAASTAGTGTAVTTPATTTETTGASSGPYRLIDFTETYTTPLKGDVRLQVVNVSTLEEAVDLYILFPGDESLDRAVPAASNIASGARSAPFSFNAGTYILIYTLTGTTDIIRQTREVALEDGAAYTHVLFDNDGGTGVISRVFEDQPL